MSGRVAYEGYYEAAAVDYLTAMEPKAYRKFFKDAVPVGKFSRAEVENGFCPSKKKDVRSTRPMPFKLRPMGAMELRNAEKKRRRKPELIQANRRSDVK